MELEVQPQQQVPGNKQQSNSEGGCKSQGGDTVPGPPWPCVIHHTHLVLEMLCRDEEK